MQTLIKRIVLKVKSESAVLFFLPEEKKKKKYLVLTFREHCYTLVTVTFKDQVVSFMITVSVLVISMGENNFSALCMLLITATFLFC